MAPDTPMDDQRPSGIFRPGSAGQSGGRALLGIYLNDHLAIATVTAGRSRYLASSCRDPELAEAVAAVAAQIAEDRRALLAIMRRLNVPVRRYKMYAGRLGERAGRLKTNGSLLRRSPLSTLLELELLQLGTLSAISTWETLRTLADRDPRLEPHRLNGLLERSRDRLRTLDDLRRRQAGRTFTG
ncbi:MULTISPECIES: hypothetical protein [Streptomyces]|uniref:hypothetical protein n=1 Tax=Streptomyces TaxID=1883 RepID=UPI001996D737|nr:MULTISPECIES: hypothetical protein [Streptomyces]MCM3266032.1 hypothetical protein [Streptomyces thermoviolaceus]WTD50508.1 hypothetical protein OG899_25125 [Streptomyces thermoviolaceus]GGV82680.1 hypothetical protein GCM10010499_48820 [Streptomyces thermoviolaceus subsp. apingens]